MINRHQAYVWSYDNPVQRHHLTERRNEPNLVRRQADLFMGLPQRGFRQGSIFGIPLAPRESNLPAVGFHMLGPERENDLGVAVIIGDRNEHARDRKSV